MTNNFTNLHVHSMYSTLDGLSKPWQIAQRAKSLGQKSIALTEHGVLAGIPDFIKACKSTCKHCGYQPNQHSNGGKGSCSIKGVICPGYEAEPIKPILGCELYLCPYDAIIKEKENGKHSHLCVLAKNKAGWKSLMKLVSKSNSPDFFYKKPRLNLERIQEFAGNLIAFSGHPGSDMANVFFMDINKAYNAKTYEEAKSYLKPWKQLKFELCELADKYVQIFGKDNFFLEIQRIDKDNLPASIVISDGLRWLAKEMKLRRVATADSHYPNKIDAIDQRILICSSIGVTLSEMDKKLLNDEEGFTTFFKSNNYHIPSYQEMTDVGCDEEELRTTNEVADMCESYDIFNKPRLPQFECPDNLSPAQYMDILCEKGWKEKIQNKISNEKLNIYQERLEMEKKVLNEAGLAPYFLIVNDICKYSQNVLGCKKSRGRGSAAGCLISYLLDITNTDPIKYTLSFERFYDSSRNNVATGEVTFPDIDMDFPISKREQIIDYVRNKYKPEKVSQMITYSRLQGRGALTEVLRAHSWGTFEQRKAITAAIPDESKIADDLQEMLEESGEASIIMWALENDPNYKINQDEKLSDYVVLLEDGSLAGPMAKLFEQAIRIEGTKKSQGKHAAGVIISPIDLEEECPMLYDKTTNLRVAGFEMAWLEAMGFVKFDFLGVAILDKIQGAVKTAATGIVGEEDEKDFGDYKE